MTLLFNDFLFIAIYLMIDLYLIGFSLFYTPEAWVIFLALFPQLLHFCMQELWSFILWDRFSQHILEFCFLSGCSDKIWKLVSASSMVHNFW